MNDFKLLTKTTNNTSLNMILQILEDADIDHLARESNIGGHMKVIAGSSIYTTKIYVVEDQFEEASSLLESFDFS